MARQQEAEFPLRLLAMLRLPFDFGVCLGAEVLFHLALAVDKNCEPQGREGRRSPSVAELRGVDPTVALCLVLLPFVPDFRHTVCEGVRSGREACWAEYETKLKDATKLAQETNWPKVIKAVLRWLFYQLKRICQVHLPVLLRKLKQRFSRSGSSKGQPAQAEAGACSGKISRDKVLKMLEDASWVQMTTQQKVSALARMIASTGENTLSFLEAQQKVVQLNLPKDPMEAYGMTEADLPQLFAEYEHDETVMMAAGQLLSPMRGDTVAAEKISRATIVEIHLLMEARMKSVLAEFEQLPPGIQRGMPRKLRENTAELLVSVAVEHGFGIHCEDIEMAVVLQEEQLKEDAEFTRCTEQLAVMVQSLVGAGL